MSANEMNARKQAKYVKRLYVYETPFKAFAFKTAGLFALGSFSIYTILELIGIGNYVRKEDRRFEDVVLVSEIRQKHGKLLTIESLLNIRNRLLFWLPPKELPTIKEIRS